MKRKLLKICMCFMLIFTVLGLNGSEAKAATVKSLSKTVEVKELFPVPNGGFSACTVSVTYTENYIPGNKKNCFESRTKSYKYKTSYTTKKPTVYVGRITHYNASGEKVRSFKKYHQLDVLYDITKWDYCSLEKNGLDRRYSKTTGRYGYVRFHISCEGALVPTRAHSVKLNLKTQ